MKKGYKIGIIVSGIALFIGILLFWIIRSHEKKMVLKSEIVSRGYISQSVTATGSVEPVDTVAVGSQVSGTIRFVYADFNSIVKKGSLLAELDKSLLQATVDQINSNLQTGRSNLIFEKNNYTRQDLLFKTDAISKADYDLALNTYKSAVAAVSGDEAALRLAKKNLSYADIYSPIDGVVLSRNISPGQTVAASFSTPTFFILAKDITKMEVDADVDEADIGNVAKGQRASFTVDAFIDDSFTGNVEEVRLHPKVTSNVVTYATIILAANPKLKLKPGMTANITIYTKEINNALLILPQDLKFFPDSTFKNTQYTLVPLAQKELTNTPDTNSKKAMVWLLHGKRIVQKEIYTGISDNKHIQVVRGLEPGDTLVTSGQLESIASASKKIVNSPFMPQAPKGGRR